MVAGSHVQAMDSGRDPQAPHYACSALVEDTLLSTTRAMLLDDWGIKIEISVEGAGHRTHFRDSGQLS